MKGEVIAVIEGVPLSVTAFDRRTAHQAGFLRPATKALGLSLGDRACLARGILREARVITAERVCKELKGLEIEVIR